MFIVGNGHGDELHTLSVLSIVDRSDSRRKGCRFGCKGTSFS